MKIFAQELMEEPLKDPVFAASVGGGRLSVSQLPSVAFKVPL